MSANAYSSHTSRRLSAQNPSFLPQLLVNEPDVYDVPSSLSANAAYTNYSTGSMFPPQHPIHPVYSPLIPSHSTYPPGTPPDPMHRWFGQKSEEPWNPSRSTTNQPHASSYNDPSFMNTRSKAGSDTESIITTHTTPPTAPSIAPSVYSADDLMKGYSDTLQIQPGMANMDLTLRPTMSRTSSQLDVPSTSQRSGSAQKKKVPLKCEHCGQECKTQSELKKHTLKHLRPFKCTIESCERYSKGFTTSNDLARHMRSRHKIFESDDVKVYKCASQSCAEKPKLWYRLDNFCQHLDRMHQAEDKEELVKSSEMRVNAGDYHDIKDRIEQGDDGHEAMAVLPQDDLLHGIGSFQTSDHFDYNDVVGQPRELDIPMSGSNTSDDLGQLSSGMWSAPQLAISQPSSGAMPNYSNSFEHVPNRKPKVIIHSGSPSVDGYDLARNWIDGAIADGCDPKSLLESIRSKLHGETTENAVYGPLYGKYHAGNSVAHSVEQARGSKNLQSKGSIHKSSRHLSIGSSQNQFKTGNELNSTASENRGLRCKYCSKELPRLSALKKHQKRHERLYGCTFESCNKTFGSKDDWKRHENSQHFQVDTWRCGETMKSVDFNGPVERPCAKLFHRKEIFSEHLKRTHHITDRNRITEECTKRHVGCNNQGSYWCGFCCEIKELTSTGGKAWDERFNHIGDHFSDGQNITKWVAQGQDGFMFDHEGEEEEAQDDLSEDFDNEEYEDDTGLGAPPSPPTSLPMAMPSYVNPLEIGMSSMQTMEQDCTSSTANKRRRTGSSFSSTTTQQRQQQQEQQQQQQQQPQYQQQQSHLVEDSNNHGSNNGFYSVNYSTVDPRFYAPIYSI